MKNRKRMLSIIIAGMIASVFAFSVPSAAQENAANVRVGELSWLQEDSEQRSENLTMIHEAVQQLSGTEAGTEDAQTDENGFPDLYSCDQEIVYFDNINSMIMALKSGDIDAAGLYSTVCRYITNNNEDLTILHGDSFNQNNPNEENRLLALAMMNAFLSIDFSFMFLEENEALRDLFNQALAEMREDGTMLRLMEEYVASTIGGNHKELTPIELAAIDGAETIKVAVTGDLPPIDYFTASGEPAGYNTAVLAEISRRIGMNIELVSIDAGARALALSSGAADVVFWARNHMEQEGSMGVQGFQILLRDHPDLSESKLTEEEIGMVQGMQETMSQIRSSENEQLDGTILSDPFYTDWYAYVIRK